MAEWDVIIVGAGIAGLTCAEELCSKGLKLLVLESSDSAGGRIATDEYEGFLLDRGFQVFLTAYPEAKRILNYPELKLNRFAPGALIWHDGKFRRFSDPWRKPGDLLATALSPVASAMDKIRIAKFRHDTTTADLRRLYKSPEITTIEMLQQRGFSPTVIERFFRPFLGGIFLEQDLNTSRRMCEFVFRMFSTGDAALPSDGMRAIPNQLASRLPEGVLRLNSPVKAVRAGGVELSSGLQLTAKHIVVATDEPTARKLTGNSPESEANRVVCMYFAADEPPIEEPILMLNGQGLGPINNVCVPSQLAANYAPPGQSLISVTALLKAKQEPQVDAVSSQLREWFGSTVYGWRHLRTYPIHYALPRQVAPALEPVEKSSRLSTGVYRCGDYCDTASINGAMASGRRAAEAVVNDFEELRTAD
ncbi:NAD(P)/FAD-dependent oxidoreductase [Bremerella sp. P1]|uniref:NAD(P)/FAD-dependent oxidoreductase n=1 Tax=Bremerella sp. P1 TaxID=3026424 RepID=UPI0023677B58|nr:FAD-dependent oxidoreductase [Bremerella sp. P1]WDI41512.1 FAD-dependent oxidoreductase [Bremerella sp. P1]